MISGKIGKFGVRLQVRFNEIFGGYFNGLLGAPITMRQRYEQTALRFYTILLNQEYSQIRAQVFYILKEA